MRPRFTNKALGWAGKTRLFSVRLPDPIAELIESRVGSPGLPDRASCLQDGMALWSLIEEQRMEKETNADRP
jgi:hypothetical protein